MYQSHARDIEPLREERRKVGRYMPTASGRPRFPRTGYCPPRARRQCRENGPRRYLQYAARKARAKATALSLKTNSRGRSPRSMRRGVSKKREWARPTGVEPVTFGFGNQHSIQLSYGRTARDSTAQYEMTSNPRPVTMHDQHVRMCPCNRPSTGASSRALRPWITFAAQRTLLLRTRCARYTLCFV